MKRHVRLMLVLLIISMMSMSAYAEEPNHIGVEKVDILEEIKNAEITPYTVWTYGHQQTKVVNSMYGKVYLTVKYDYNHTENYAKITGIVSLYSEDPYMEEIDRYYSSTSATGKFYDRTHKTFVDIKITASELKIR